MTSCTLTKICSEALSVRSSCGIIDLSEPGGGPQQPQSLTTRVRRLPPRLQDSVVMEAVGDRPTADCKTTFKQQVYLPMMDTLLSELTRRFDSIQCAVMRDIKTLNPCSDKFANLDQIQSFAEAYDANMSDLEHELHQAKRMRERLSYSSKNDENIGGVPSSLVGIVTYVARYSEALHDVYRLGRIAVALPVSTTSFDRSFSPLGQIKTWVRNTMSDSKLRSVAVLGIECERVNSMSIADVVDAFVVAHKNRRIPLL